MFYKLQAEMQIKADQARAKKEKNENPLGNLKVLPDVMDPADRLRRKLDEDHGVQLGKLIEKEEQREVALYGPSKKPPPSPGQFKAVNSLEKSKQYFNQFMDPQLAAKNVEA